MGLLGNALGSVLGEHGGSWLGGKIGGSAGANLGGKLGQIAGGAAGDLLPFKTGGRVGKGMKKGTKTPILAHAGEFVLPLNAKPTAAQKKIVAQNKKKVAKMLKDHKKKK